jgi:hypothetical protein
MISGDGMIASIEDNHAELCLAALESINGFHKKTGKSFSEMFDSKHFDQYTKTCLWTSKARRGIDLSARMKFRNKHRYLGDLQEDSDFDVADTSAMISFTRVDAADMVNTYDYFTKKLIKELEDNPNLMTREGRILVYPVAKKLGISRKIVNNIIKYMETRNE